MSLVIVILKKVVIGLGIFCLISGLVIGYLFAKSC